jgi:Flp pilus assembly protein TadG
VEITLVAPLLLLLLIGAVEIGRAAYYSIATVNAARAAVQYGAQNKFTAGDNTGIRQAALNDAPSGMLSPDNVAIRFTYECPDGSAASDPPTSTDCSASGGRYISYLWVNTQLQFMPLINFPGLPPSFSCRGEAVMRIGN